MFSTNFSVKLSPRGQELKLASGTARANGAAVIGATSVNVDGFSGVLKAGDMVKFSNHSKVYMITADRSGAGALAIQPALRVALTNDLVITYDNVPFTVRLNNDVQSYSLESASLLDYEVDFIEAV